VPKIQNAIRHEIIQIGRAKDTGYDRQSKGAAILAVVFDRQARTWRTKSPSEFEDLEGFFIPGAKFSCKARNARVRNSCCCRISS
jgi:hypothetical protein